VLTRPGRYKQIADNLEVKGVWVDEGERRKRYVLCLNPQEAERERARRAQLLIAPVPNWPCWSSARRIIPKLPVR
jgi:hypothetical protein